MDEVAYRDKTRQLEYQVRFGAGGEILGESLHPRLGQELGIALGSPDQTDIYSYLDGAAVLDKDLPGRLTRRVQRLLDSHDEFSINGDFYAGSEARHLHISGRAIRSLSGDLIFSLHFIDDTAHTQLRRLYEYMFRLASHELKGPLACVFGATEYAEEHVEAGRLDGVKNCLEMIDRNANAIADMITRYLNLSLIESGSFKIEPSEILLTDDVLNPMVRDMHPALEARGMSVEFECPGLDHEPHVYADADKVEIVLRNLVSNALKYGKAKTVIRVVLTKREETVEVGVENEGPSIPKPYLNRLFQKFMRLDAPRGTRGTGLGLYNSRRIVELWGGAMSVVSNEDRTRFSFTIPTP